MAQAMEVSKAYETVSSKQKPWLNSYVSRKTKIQKNTALCEKILKHLRNRLYIKPVKADDIETMKKNTKQTIIHRF